MYTRRLLASAVLGGLTFAVGIMVHLHAASALHTTMAHATPTTVPVVLSPDGPIPPSIRTTVRRGSLAVTLLVEPVVVGPVRFTITVYERGTRITDATVRVRLSMPVQPVFGDVLLTTARCGASYCAQGTFAALGRWHVEVLVHLPDRASTSIDVPFDIMDGANAAFLFAQPPSTTAFGPVTVVLNRTADGSYILLVHLHARLAVRALLDMPNMMSMGTAVYPATPRAQGWYGVTLAFPMTGVAQVRLEVRKATRWGLVRLLLYDVDSSGRATLLTNTPT